MQRSEAGYRARIAEMQQDTAEKTLMVVRVGRLGDFLVSVPAMAALRRAYPGSRLILLTGLSSIRHVANRATSYSGIKEPPWVRWTQPEIVDEVVVFSDIFSFRDWCRLRTYISSARIAETFVLPYFGGSRFGAVKMMLWLRSLGVRGPIHTRAKERHSRPHKVSEQMWTPIEMVASARGVFPEWRSWRLELPQEAVGQVRDRWRLKGGDLIFVVSAAATHEHKRWPIERFAELLKRAICEVGASIVLVGGVAEKQVCEALARLLPAASCRNLCGHTTLSDLAAIIGACDLYIGNDGGAAHLAAALGIDTVTIMSGVNLPGVWDPSGVRARAVRVSGLGCVGCRNELHCPLGHRRCISEISVEMVYEECRAALGTRWSTFV